MLMVGSGVACRVSVGFSHGSPMAMASSQTMSMMGGVGLGS